MLLCVIPHHFHALISADLIGVVGVVKTFSHALNEASQHSVPSSRKAQHQ